MTPEEKVALLKEAGVWGVIGYPGCIDKLIDLVADHAREAFAKESLEVLDNLRKETIARCHQGMIEAYKLGQSEGREACAKVCEETELAFDISLWCDSTKKEMTAHTANGLAAAIRARSNHG